MKYRFSGKERLLSLGIYPSVSLQEAREKRDQAKKMLNNKSDPSELKKRLKSNIEGLYGNTFEVIAKEWIQTKKTEWSNAHFIAVKKILEANVFGLLGKIPIDKITAPELLSMLRKVEEREAYYLTKRLLFTCGQVFRYAIATGRAEHNPAPDLRGALIGQKKNHFKYLSEDDLKSFKACLEGSTLNLQLKLAIRLLQLTFVRSNELILAKWNEISFEKKEWRIPAVRMKRGEQLIVPLSTQSLEVLEQLKDISRSDEFIFPGFRSPIKPMSSKSILKAFYSLGLKSKTTPHGLRGSASTILNENGFRAEVIEYQLSHSEKNKVRAAYNHAQYLPERKAMMQWWGDFLEKLSG
jgi:integrase